MSAKEPLLWRILARVLSSSPIRSALWRRAVKHPYTHIGPEEDHYMLRGWIFNPYNRAYRARIPWLPSIRLHVIRRPDSAAHMHDHPLRSRVILLKGWYCEQRYGRPTPRTWTQGETYALRPGVDFHNIYATPAEGAISLFITWPPRAGGVDGEWGFLVDGEKVGHLTYKNLFGRDSGRMEESHEG